MSTHRGLVRSRGLTAAQLAGIRPKTGFKTYQCSYCGYRLKGGALHVVQHEAACSLRLPVEQLRAMAWRKFVRAWEAR